ncbi:hypothetical protein [Prevotella sp. E13-27]|nr:hypothetical protein [Prevotella sp. E13-27]MCK8622559.1 hypothetical protein [Prevotella sp. E13-27]
MEHGVEEIYVKPAKAMGLKVWSGTLLPTSSYAACLAMTTRRIFEITIYA